MAEAPELPEAKDPFERLIALTIAIIAVVLAFVDNRGNSAKTDAIIHTTEAANKWAYFQSKSLKENLASNGATMLGLLTPVDAGAAKAKQEQFSKEVGRYEEEKAELKKDAEELEKQARECLEINEHAERAALLLQVAVVVCSIAILVRWKAVYFAGLIVGIIGIVFAYRAFHV